MTYPTALSNRLPTPIFFRSNNPDPPPTSLPHHQSLIKFDPKKAIDKSVWQRFLLKMKLDPPALSIIKVVNTHMNVTLETSLGYPPIDVSSQQVVTTARGAAASTTV